MIQTKPEITSEMIAAAIKQAAPLHEAYPILVDWLRKRGGIVFANAGGYWVAKAWDEGHGGENLPNHDTLPELLKYALEYAENHIRQSAIEQKQGVVE